MKSLANKYKFSNQENQDELNKYKNEVNKYNTPSKCPAHFCNLNTIDNHNHYLCISCYTKLKTIIKDGK